MRKTNSHFGHSPHQVATEWADKYRGAFDMGYEAYRDIALARELGVGVHLGSEQLQQLQQRPLPESVLVGASCHDLAQLQAAQRLGCDFAVLGPVQATASHPGATPLGWAAFEQLREQVSLPIYAIGGLAAADIDTARRHGAQGVAAIRALWPRPATG